MTPDLNTLPTSRRQSLPSSPSQSRPRRISIGAPDAIWPAPPSPRSPPLSSLHAAATINAGLHRSPSNASPGGTLHPAIERRRSSLMNNLNINDPTTPAPGEMQQNSNCSSTSPGTGRRSFAFQSASPPHHRHPSLGELHQELENEQEAQVNRLLHMIRLQQDQLAAFQRQQSDTASTAQTSSEPPSAVTEPDSTTTPLSSQLQAHLCSPRTSPSLPHPLSRHSSSTQHSSPPALGPISGTDIPLLAGTTTMRDEIAFYQAETQTLRRENRMLKARVRELERQISELDKASAVDSEAG
ncbi:hypothetical protein KC360_g4082 [Hortaea werneckii]|uniref:Uncharacterized protein n=1 Tax=Hortaea werneckii TaxID=91943 RepID=A0A3M7FRM7_HORWE|nr:hypothetical protein KC325_g4832 [Hortaea werneckii]KAI6994138.1 hypothetical protein KC359_g4786 [Hortaea werneckii]KAI7145951.1 hypothetical protein KC344_g4059 [Hortaea werneckii]KAI7174792.1 hypothetical protein KC360_g4082 [Hortaea werneckii]KAI7510233.1 hypothetical protein KC347_g4509 [Hortaea werneckii]